MAIEKKILNTQLFTETKGGLRIKNPTTLVVSPHEIEFRKSPFRLKNEISAMAGARWHGYDKENPRKTWTVHNCQRNWFQLKYLMGQNPYEWFDRELIEYEYTRPLMEHQKLLANTGLTYHYQIWAASMGVGKSSLTTTPVLTPTGWTTMGQLRVGSRLVDPDGGECKVLSLHPQGKLEVFKVTFTDHSSTVCSAEHLWRVSNKRAGNVWYVKELQELVSEGLQDCNGDNKWYIPLVEPVDFDKRSLKCHPYVMGYTLVNGCMRDYTVSIPDQETVDRLNSFMSVSLKHINHTDYSIECPEVRQAINEYGLRYRVSKSIPEDFLYNDLESRLYLIQGILDSGGTPDHSLGVKFCTAHIKIAAEMVFLIQSMGGTCNMVLEEKPAYTCDKKLEHRIVGAFNPGIAPFLLSRKADLYVASTKYHLTRGIVSVESIDFDECICIRVDSKNRCYVTNDFIVTHNTLAAQEVMERSGCKSWFWVGPLKSLENIEREWEKWGMPLTWCIPKNGNDLIDAVGNNEHNIYLTTYERLVKFMESREADGPIPGGVIFDESSRLKSETAKRSKVAQDLADLIRVRYGVENGFVILMSGTPSPKSPLDWWKQCEIVWPGFLKEGSKKQLENRLGFLIKQELPDNIINVRVGWKDNNLKCNKCTRLRDEHVWDMDSPETITHDFEESVNEVAYMYERLAGLVTVVSKDILTLPEKVYEIDYCEPSASTLRVAKTLVKAAPNVMTGMTWLRELSDGFLYKDIPDGLTTCNICLESEKPGEVKVWMDPDGEVIEAIDMLDEEYVSCLKETFVECPRCNGTKQITKMKRVAREVPCPKEAKLKARLAQCEETGRIVIFAGFQGSIDRIKSICKKEGWEVVQCDGRGWAVYDKTGKLIKTDKPLHYWSDLEYHQQVAFVAHPQSGGLSLNLTESRMTVFWSNDFNPESRSQAEDRIHRKGMDENKGCKIVDIYHLPTDEKVRKVLKENRKLELMTMGELTSDLTDGE